MENYYFAISKLKLAPIATYGCNIMYLPIENRHPEFRQLREIIRP